MIYCASRTTHAALWLFLRDECGWPISSTWINEAGEGESADLSDLWMRCINEVRSASCLVAYHTPGDVWKGAFIEIGVALGKGIPVHVIGEPPGSWVNHPLISKHESMPLLSWLLAEVKRHIEENAS
jgi:hypothetical protein